MRQFGLALIFGLILTFTITSCGDSGTSGEQVDRETVYQIRIDNLNDGDIAVSYEGAFFYNFGDVAIPTTSVVIEEDSDLVVGISQEGGDGGRISVSIGATGGAAGAFITRGFIDDDGEFTAEQLVNSGSADGEGITFTVEYRSSTE